MEPYMPYIWLAVILIMTVVEAATAQLVSIWFVAGGVAALFVCLFSDHVLLQLAVFVLVSVATLIATRPFVSRMMRFRKEDTNAGRYIGKTGRVIVAIDNEKGFGQVNVSGSIWTAKSVDDAVLPVDTCVIVEAIEGVKLVVRPVATPEP